MNSHPLVPLFQLHQPSVDQTPRRETERELFERMAANLRQERRRARRAARTARLRHAVAPGSKRVAA